MDITIEPTKEELRQLTKTIFKTLTLSGTAITIMLLIPYQRLNHFAIIMLITLTIYSARIWRNINKREKKDKETRQWDSGTN